jgi:gustatory receptor
LNTSQSSSNKLSLLLSSAIFCAQLFGLFPINISAKNTREVAFRWRSLRAVFSLLTILTSATSAMLVLESQIQSGPLTPRNVIGVVFFGSCCYIAILFVRLSIRWRMLLIHWMRTEALLSSDDYKLPKWRWSLRQRLASVTALYLSFSLIEHSLSLLSLGDKVLVEIETCNRTDINPVELFITRHLGYIFDSPSFRYNHAIGFAAEYLNVSYTIYWNFLDLFIILTSIGIAFLFERINTRLQNIRGLLVNVSVWAEIRSHHFQVTELLKHVNSYIDAMLMVACFNDGYFILSQMVNITT